MSDTSSSSDNFSVEPVVINKLPLTENIYQGCGEDGRLRFRQNIKITASSMQVSLPGNALVALGLTEVCRRVGQGKVRNSKHTLEIFH